MTHNTPVIIVAGMGRNTRAIGIKNGLIWHVPEDLKRFKALTLGHPIIMGRKTFQSIGRVLPGRTNIVITREPTFQVDGVVVVHSLTNAIEKASEEIASSSPRNDGKTDEIFIIGGAQIYEQALPLTDKLYLTVIDNEIDGDVFFPDYSDFSQIVSDLRGEPGEFSYRFLELEKRNIPKN